MSDTVKSYFDTGVAFLNNRQKGISILDSAEKTRLELIFNKISRNDNQALELMYRYFKCMNELVTSNESKNEILKYISELYLENENSIGMDILSFCKKYLRFIENSDESIEVQKQLINGEFKNEAKGGDVSLSDYTDLPNSSRNVYNAKEVEPLYYVDENQLLHKLDLNVFSTIGNILNQESSYLSDSDRRLVISKEAAYYILRCSFDEQDKMTAKYYEQLIDHNKLVRLLKDISLTQVDFLDIEQTIRNVFAIYKISFIEESNISISDRQNRGTKEKVLSNNLSEPNDLINMLFTEFDSILHNHNLNINSESNARKLARTNNFGFISVGSIFATTGIVALGMMIANIIISR